MKVNSRSAICWSAEDEFDFQTKKQFTVVNYRVDRMLFLDFISHQKVSTVYQQSLTFGGFSKKGREAFLWPFESILNEFISFNLNIYNAF